MNRFYGAENETDGEKSFQKYSPNIHLGGVRKIEKRLSMCGHSLVALSIQWYLKYLEGVLMLCCSSRLCDKAEAKQFMCWKVTPKK
jgi:hypothetical protein